MTEIASSLRAVQMNKEAVQNLISFDEVINLARLKGVDFGKGDPYNRLRYYIKIGLLPKAVRKSFNGLPPTGALPIETVDKLVEIDNQIKNGESIRAVVKSLKRSSFLTPGVVVEIPQKPPSETGYLVSTPVTESQKNEFLPKTSPQSSDLYPPETSQLTRSDLVSAGASGWKNGFLKGFNQLWVKRIILGTASLSVIVVLLSVGFFLDQINRSKDIKPSELVNNDSLPPISQNGQTLGSTIEDGLLSVNVNTVIKGLLTASGGIKTENADIDAGTGQLTASNVIYDILPGQNVTVTEGQTPTISLNTSTLPVNVVGTVNRITVGGNVIDIAAGYVGQTSITTLGTITTGTWQATPLSDAFVNNDITLDNITQITNRDINNTTGTLPVNRGGTGQISFTLNALLYGNSTNGILETSVNGGATQCLTQTSGGAPAWGACGGAAGITIRETDGSPSVAAATFLEFGPATTSSDEFVVTDEGSGTARVRTGAKVVLTDATQTLTNKTIAAGSNTISGLTNANLSGSAGITNANLANSSITFAGDSGSSATSLGGTRTVAGGTGITTAEAAGTITVTANTSAGVTTSGDNIVLDVAYSPTWTGVHTFTPSGTNDFLVNLDADSTAAFTFTSATNASSGQTYSVTNSSAAGTVAVNASTVTLVGTATSGANTITGLNFANVTTVASNTFNGLTFGTGYNNFITSPTINITAAGAITGATGITSSGTITFSALSTDGGVVYADNSGVLGQTTAGASGQCLLSGGAGNPPTYGSCGAGAGGITVRETDTSPSVSGVTVLEFGPATTSSDEFVVTDEGSGTARVRTGAKVVLTDATQTLTNKTIDALSNTISNLDFINFQDSMDLDANTSIAAGNSLGLTLTSSLTSGARSTDVLTITQANDATNNSTGNLLQLTNSDTGSTVAVLDINQAGNDAIGIQISNAISDSGSMGINFSGAISNGSGINFNEAISSSGSGIQFDSISSGIAIDFAGGGSGNILTSGKLLSYSNSPSGSLTAFTGDLLNFALSRTHTGATSINDTGNYLDITRANTNTNAGGTFTISGDLATLSSNCTQTLGTCTDTSNILSLTQSYASASGAVLEISNAGTGNSIDILGAGTRAINSTSGNLSILTTTSGNIILNPAGSLVFSDFTNNNNSVLYTGVSGAVNVAETTGTGNCLLSNGAGAAPSWSSCGAGASGQTYTDGTNTVASATQLTFQNFFTVGGTTPNATVTITDDILDFAQFSNTMTLDEDTSIATGNTGDISITSSLTGGARSTDVLTISQANDATNDSTGNLLQLTNLDTGSTAPVLDIVQDATGGTGILISDPSGGGGSGTRLEIRGHNGFGFQTTDRAIVIGGSGASDTILNSGVGIEFKGAVQGGAGIQFTSLSAGNAILIKQNTGGGGNAGQAIEIEGARITSGDGLVIEDSLSATLTAFSGNLIKLAPTRTHTGATAIDDTGNFLAITRANTNTNAGGTFTISGDLATLSSNCTQTLGTCTDTSNILSLTQSYASATGAVIEISNAGTGAGILFEQGTTVVDGIQWGTDANAVTLYRSANDTLRTGDNLTIDLDATISGGDLYITPQASSASTTEGTIYYDSDDDQLKV
ncbi:MAG TPA: hypothetical protein VIH52_00475, partial [Candidatus Nanoarchaeia archaeon]